MQRTMVAALTEHVGGRARVAGWIHHQRDLAHLSFLLLRDASGIAQIVIEDETVRAAARELLPETVVEMDGEVVMSMQAPGGVELHDPALEVVARPQVAPPFEMRRPGRTA